jgi:serine protease Do
VLIAAALLARASAQDAPGSVAESLAGEVRTVFERAQKAVVRIEATDRHGPLSGTGFFVDPSGTLFTSYTIGGESTDIEVHCGTQKYTARRLLADPRSGVAVLKVDAETPFIKIGESRALAVGAPVIVVGYPMDLPASPSFGCVSGFDIKYLDRYFATRHIRASVPVQRGQGGAPLLNMQGEAVGILIAGLDQGSACFNLPIEAAQKVHKDFVRFGELRPGWLGVGIEPAQIAHSGSTAEINALNLGAPGEKAGLRAGDVLLELGSHKIASPEDVLDASFYIAAEDEVKMRVARDGQTIELTVTATDRPNTSVRTAGDIPSFAPAGGGDLRGSPLNLDR